MLSCWFLPEQSCENTDRESRLWWQLGWNLYLHGNLFYNKLLLPKYGCNVIAKPIANIFNCAITDQQTLFISNRSRQVAAGPANKLVARGHSSGGILTQCDQVTDGSHSANDKHRGGISSRRRADISTHGKSSEVRRQNICSLTVWVTTAYFWLSLLGLLSLATDAIPLGRLHLRPLQIYLLAHWAPSLKDLKALIAVKHDLLDHHLKWWLDRECTRARMPLDIPETQAHLFTDASESGWGAHLANLQVSGVWSPREAMLHINQLERLAVHNALLAFKWIVDSQMTS